MSLEYSFTFPLPNGLHARPASRIEEVASRFVSEAVLVNQRNGREGSMRSVLQLVGLDCSEGDTCTFRITGADEQESFASLKALVEGELPHCDDALPATIVPVGELRLPPSLRAVEFGFVRGVPVVPGIGRGRVVRIGHRSIFDSPPVFPAMEPDREIERISLALTSLEKRINSQLGSTQPGVQKEIMKAHRSIVRDQEMKAKLVQLIESQRCSSAAAIIGAARHFTEVLEASDNALLHERVLDIQDICEQLLEEVYGPAASSPRTVLEDHSICMADDLTPSQFLALDRRYLHGLVLGATGATSHAAILARSFAIPILGGVDFSEAGVRGGEEVVLDADLGILVTELTPRVTRYYQQEERTRARRFERLVRSYHERCCTKDGRQVGVAANLSSPCELENPLSEGADGVGLFRTEMLFLDREGPPDEEEQVATYRAALEKLGGRPLTIRTLDIGGDKPLPYLNLPTEANPYLGYRAVRMYPEFEKVVSVQFRALVRASVHGPLRILIPMVSCVEEVCWVKELLARARRECACNGTPAAPDIPLGIMLEVPSAAFQIDQLCREVDYFSIGTNDLLQYFMAADRQNPKVSHLFDWFQPSFLRFLKMIVDAVHAHGKKVGMCGEMAGSVEALPVLVGLGVDELSMAIPLLAEIKDAIRRLSSSSCGQLAEEMLASGTVAEVRSLLRQPTDWQAELPLIDQDLIDVDSECSSREEAIKQIVGGLYVTGRTMDPVAVEEDVWRREAVYSTGLGHGFAIPHCKSPAVSANSISLLKLKHPVSWDSSDGKPVDVVILLAIRESDKDNTHMKVFSRLARKVVHEEFRDALRKAADADQILRVLEDAIDME